MRVLSKDTLSEEQQYNHGQNQAQNIQNKAGITNNKTTLTGTNISECHNIAMPQPLTTTQTSQQILF